MDYWHDTIWYDAFGDEGRGMLKFGDVMTLVWLVESVDPDVNIALDFTLMCRIQ